MSDFAKIVIATDGAQVLFFKDNGEDGPELVQMTCVDGVSARLGLGFDDDDEGEAARDRAFEKAGVAMADVVRKTVLGMLARSAS